MKINQITLLSSFVHSRYVSLRSNYRLIIWISWDAHPIFITILHPEHCIVASKLSWLLDNLLIAWWYMWHFCEKHLSVRACTPGSKSWKYLTYLTTSDWNLSSPLSGLFTGSCHLPLWCWLITDGENLDSPSQISLSTPLVSPSLRFTVLHSFLQS